jgi:hypothetical protein
VWAIVVARAGPLVGPYPLAACASVKIEKPGHAGLLRSQTIISARDEFDKAPVAQILKLLTYLGFDVLVAGVEIAQMPLESVDFIKREVTLAKRLHAFHDIEQPAACIRRFIPEEKRLPPFREDEFLRANDAALYDMDFSGVRDAAEQDIGTNPARAPRSDRKRLTFLNDLANEKVLRHDEQINDRERLEVVVHKEKIGVVAGSQTLTFRLERAIDDPHSEFALLTLEFELLIAGRAEEIREWTVVREGRNLRVAAVRAICPCTDPCFRPCPSALRAAGIGRLGFFEAEFHHISTVNAENSINTFRGCGFRLVINRTLVDQLINSPSELDERTLRYLESIAY